MVIVGRSYSLILPIIAVLCYIKLADLAYLRVSTLVVTKNPKLFQDFFRPSWTISRIFRSPYDEKNYLLTMFTVYGRPKVAKFINIVSNI